MENQFIGLHMRVLLKDPSGYRLTGTVRDVEAGSSLTLTNVYVDATKEHAPQMTIRAANIADLFEVPRDDVAPTVYSAPMPEIPIPAPSFSVQPHQSTFVDPAILSVGRRPTGSFRPASGPSLGPDGDLESQDGEAEQPDLLPVGGLERHQPVHAGRMQALAEPVWSLTLGPTQSRARSRGNGKQAAGKSVEAQSEKKRAQSRQGKQAKKGSAEARDTRSVGDDAAADAAAAAASASAASTAQGGRGKGWRQTPILESSASFQPFSALKRQRKGRKGAPDNGWASEEVTEGMGDFDFENNLAKFDKRTIFDQIRKEDQTDDASRLVSHNRRAKPGTAGGKNLHYTENVLELPSTSVRRASDADFWNSEADVEAAKQAERPAGWDSKNGGLAPRSAEGKLGPSRRTQARKGAGLTGSGAQPLSRASSTQQLGQPGLYSATSNRRLEAISTLQMLNLENIAANDFGLSESLMAENAGRGIAEVAAAALSDPAMKARFELGATGVSLANSTIVILAGNNKSGVRALAAGRHLRNKNVDVLVCVVGIERERELLEDLRRQMQLYRNFGGKVLGKNDFFERLRSGTGTGSGPGPGSGTATAAGAGTGPGMGTAISLIIDALLGLTISFEELRIGDQAAVYELMEWANRNEAFVLSVDVPTGMDPTTGKIALIDGSQLYVKPRYVVAVGAPKRGLVEALAPPSDGEPGRAGEAAQEDEWRLFVADMGLGSAVWRKAGTKMRRGIDFDGKWVLEMRYRGPMTEEEEE